jgi:hypothetical protein
MKNLQNILLENILRYGVKNLSESDIQRLSLLEQETQEKILKKRITFPSGMHSAQKGNVAGVLGNELKAMQDFLVANKGSVVEIILSSSESQVPNYDAETNPKTKLQPGQLSKMRYATIETYMTQWLQGLVQQGIITQMPKIIPTQPVIGKTAWNPPANATPEQVRQLAASTQYTNEQWLEVTLKVVSDTSDIPVNEFGNVVTYREPAAALNNFNASLFYNASVGPAAVLQVNPTSLPGALLTMNTKVGTRTAINLTNFKLPVFEAKIVADSPNEVPLVYIPTKGGGIEQYKINQGTWQQWSARISNTYSIIVPFEEGTPGFKNAWLFIYFYIMSGYPTDWNFISNKPANIDFSLIRNVKNVSPTVADSSLAYQQRTWSQKNLPDAEGNETLTMSQWYKLEVDTFYGNNTATPTETPKKRANPRM